MDYFTQKIPCIYESILLLNINLIFLLIQCTFSSKKPVCFRQKNQDMKLLFISFPKESMIWLIIKLHRNTYTTHTWEAEGM